MAAGRQSAYGRLYNHGGLRLSGTAAHWKQLQCANVPDNQISIDSHQRFSGGNYYNIRVPYPILNTSQDPTGHGPYGFSASLPRGSAALHLLSGRPDRCGTVLPGVKWSALEIWEGSAAADVWLYATDYADFRKYALSGLSGLGFLDHPLRLFPGTLRVVSGFGKPTGMARQT